MSLSVITQCVVTVTLHTQCAPQKDQTRNTTPYNPRHRTEELRFFKLWMNARLHRETFSASL